MAVLAYCGMLHLTVHFVNSVASFYLNYMSCCSCLMCFSASMSTPTALFLPSFFKSSSISCTVIDGPGMKFGNGSGILEVKPGG